MSVSKLLPAAITHVRRITVSYLSVNCSVRYSGVTTAENRFLFATERRTLVSEYKQYGRHTLTIARFLVAGKRDNYNIIGYIH